MMRNDLINNLKNEAIALISQASSKDELEQLRINYVGKKGKINQLFSELKKSSKEERIELGKVLNEAKKIITQALNSQQVESLTSDQSWVDVTQPGERPPTGHLHPISQAIEEITQIFEGIGFTRVRYPEVDFDKYVFENLNMPPDHPARDEWETFFIDTPKNKQNGEVVLTTHTSNGQVREMERVGKPPVRMLNLGKCYRRQQDVTHTAMFHQFEGLVVDEGINIQHLKGTLDYFAKKFYGPKAKSRIRPFMFKFTEPSFEVDFSCTHCGGKGCRFCKSGWHEVGGAGMVHPNVLRAGGIDPDKYTGFAFGWGVERVYTLKPGLELDDIRPLYSNNLEFLRQF
ncbi:phenylalanine--tRNA ligase subunit alpha [Patescibacteria group bacterium]